MTPGTKTKGGSFGELRDRHLLLFGGAEHRHERGWTHPPRKDDSKVNPWKTVGILHLRRNEEEDG